jgi:hypothetical protein
MYQVVNFARIHWLYFGSYPAGNVPATTALHEVQRVEVGWWVFPTHAVAGSAARALAHMKHGQHFTDG